MVKLGLEARENEMIKRDGCGRRLSEITQCQGCGYSVFQVEYSLPEGWSEDSTGLWYCDECLSSEDRPLLGSEYDEEFDPSTYDTTAHQSWLDNCSPNYGPDDIGLRSPCDGYFAA